MGALRGSGGELARARKREPEPEPETVGEDDVKGPVEPPAPVEVEAHEEGEHQAAPGLLGDLHSDEDPQLRIPAKEGWQGWINRLSGGFLSVRPGKEEVLHRRAVAGIQSNLTRSMTILLANSAGGAGKTVTAMGLGGVMGLHRGGGVVVCDNNETQGSLSLRSKARGSDRTVLDLLGRTREDEDLTLGELSAYLRTQGNAHFDVLASSTRPEEMRLIGKAEFELIHDVLSRFKELVIVDSGNNALASNFQAAAEAADLLLVPTGMQRDQIQRALWTLRTLYEAGHEDLVTNAIVVISEDSRGKESGGVVKELNAALDSAGMDIITIPYDPHLDRGTVIDVELLRDKTRHAYEQLAALVAHKLLTLPNEN